MSTCATTSVATLYQGSTGAIHTQGLVCVLCRYNEEADYDEWVMLIYDGLHYDALAVSAFEGAPEELDITSLQVQYTL